MKVTLVPLLLAVVTAACMAVGQILFKLGSAHWDGDGILALALALLKNPFLVTAIILYALTILLWIYVLKHLPLTVAYPVTALSYVIVPLISVLLLRERIDLYTVIGIFFIIVGIAFTSIRTV